MKVFSSTFITTLLLVATNLAESGPGEQRDLSVVDVPTESVIRSNLRAYFQQYENTNTNTDANSERRELEQQLEAQEEQNDDLSAVGPYVFTVRMIGLMCVFPFWATYMTVMGIVPLMQFLWFNLFYFYCSENDTSSIGDDPSGGSTANKTNIFLHE